MKTGLLVSILLLGGARAVQAQVAARPLPTWEATLPRGAGIQDSTRSHTGTGLLVGGIVGVTAATVFLIGFCADPDTKCEMDEVGRALLFIAVPTAALGALIGSLIHS